MRGPARNRFCSRPSGDGSAWPIKKRRVWTKGHHNSLVPLQRIKIALPSSTSRRVILKKGCRIQKMPFHNVRWKMVFAKPRLPQNRSAWQCLSQANRQFDFISFKRCSPVCGGDTFGDTVPCDKEIRDRRSSRPCRSVWKVKKRGSYRCGCAVSRPFKREGGGVRK